MCHDSIVRTVYYQEYYHPKEAFIKSPCVVRELERVGNANSSDHAFLFEGTGASDRMSIAYPFGCSLEVKTPAVPVLTSGQLCFPANRAICAYAQVSPLTHLPCGVRSCS